MLYVNHNMSKPQCLKIVEFMVDIKRPIIVKCRTRIDFSTKIYFILLTIKEIIKAE